jgi:hypothetical protein
MTLDDAIERGRVDQTIPKEISEVISKKFRLVVSVTTKSLDPQAPKKPAYQVHRIAVKYGPDAAAAAPTVRRRTRLALASASTSSGGGLNVLGEALADELLADQTSAGIMPPDGSAILSSTDTAGSLVSTSLYTFFHYSVRMFIFFTKLAA